MHTLQYWKIYWQRCFEIAILHNEDILRTASLLTILCSSISRKALWIARCFSFSFFRNWNDSHFSMYGNDAHIRHGRNDKRHTYTHHIHWIYWGKCLFRFRFLLSSLECIRSWGQLEDNRFGSQARKFHFTTHTLP